MSRLILASAVVFALFLGMALVFVWYVSFGMGHPADGEVQVSPITQPARLSYRGDGTVVVSAASERDAYLALGYQAARDNGWTVALLRQAAIGRLGEWFGDPVLEVDRFARTMGFAASARKASARLSRSDGDMLEAYAEGVSAGLNEPGVALGNEFVLFDIRPEPWEPWHSIAIEKMIAWLAEPPIRPEPGDSLSELVQDFEQADVLFRTFLHVHGAEMSTAWAWQDSTASRFTVRYVYGASALPLFSPVRMNWPGSSVAGVALLGTPILPVMSGASSVRIVMFSSDRSIQAAAVVSGVDSLRTRHERVAGTSGNEHLVSVAQVGDRILLGVVGGQSETDSVFTGALLSWAGLTGVTDWPTWRQIAMSVGRGLPDQTDPATFELAEGDGLFLTPSGFAATGAPEFAHRSEQLLFVANDTLGAYPAVVAESLLVAGLLPAPGVYGTEFSLWASRNLPRALGLASRSASFDAKTTDATEYLRNWDYRYDLSSIGAVIFDSWMLHFRTGRGRYPEITVPGDSLARSLLEGELTRSLRAATDSLVQIGGPDLARWRLEQLRGGQRFFPGWTFDPLRDHLPGLNRSRYAPIDIPQPGHPTALAWQPGLDDYPANSPSHIVVGGKVGDPRSMTARPDYRIGSGFIARYIAGPPQPEPEPKSADEVLTEVVLVPTK